MRYLIEHETVLEYPSPIREHHIELRLVPVENSHQKVFSCCIETDPVSHLAHYNDYFGNRVDYFCVIPQHHGLTTRLLAEVETIRENPFMFESVTPELQMQWIGNVLRKEPHINDFVLHRSPVTPSAMKIAKLLDCAFPRFDREQPVMQSLMALMSWITDLLEYRSGSTEVHAELASALKLKAGVCQDFAHLFITIARSWGIPARYVMGYLDPGICSSTEEIATHAWAEALVPGGGWIGFDATHNLLANDHYISVAVGRDSYDAAPQRGSFKGGGTGSMPKVKVTVQRQQENDDNV